MNIKQTSSGNAALTQWPEAQSATARIVSDLGARLPTSLSSWLFALSLVFSPLNDFAVAEHISYGDVFLALAVLMAVFERFYHREVMPLMPVYLIAMAGLIVCYMADHVLQPGDQFKSFMVIFTMLALFPQAILMLRIGDLREMKFMVYAWTLGGLISSFYAIGYCNDFFPSHVDIYWKWDHRARGLTPHPNRLGLNCYMSLCGLLLLISSSRTLFGKIVGIALIGVTLRALDYSGSRAGMVAAFVVLGAWGAMVVWEQVKNGQLNRRMGATLVIWSGVLFFVVGIYSAVMGRIPLLQGTLDRLLGGSYASDTGRATLNDRAWEGFFSNPFFGEGFQWFGIDQPHVAHNIYLQYLNSVGMVGFAVFMLVILYPLIYPIKKQLITGNASFKILNMPLLATALALLVWLKPQSGFTNYQGLLVVGLLAYISVWRLYDRP